ncbi:MAG: DUF3343 domain-containing protein [Clostridia bacterium]|nr:DUF3343 domain-containing protein [Clostridia bacterium]
MFQVIVLLSSATTALRLKKSLADKGFSSYVIQTPKHLAIGGCGYSLRTSYNCLNFLYQEARRMDVRIKGVYQETETEKGYEYTRLS